jgi:hypothetical protein
LIANVKEAVTKVSIDGIGVPAQPEQIFIMGYAGNISDTDQGSLAYA